jgi:hypothetical protein
MPPPDEEQIEEWNFFQCAKWLGVAPWDLLDRSIAWINKATYYANIEAEIQEMRAKNANHSR